MNLENKQFDAAGKFYNRAIEEKPTKAAELLLLWGLSLLADDQADAAVAVFQRGVKDEVLPPENPAMHYYLAGALEMAGHTEEAVKAAKTAADLNKTNPRLAARIAWVYYHARDYDRARKAYADLVAEFDDVRTSEEVRAAVREARLVLSAIAVQQNNLSQGEEWLEQVLDEFPGDVGAMNDLGYIWADQNKNLRRALAMTERAVAAEPDNAAYRDSLGWALYRVGRYDEALENLKKAVAKEEDPDGVILDHLGDIYQALNQTDQARDAWRRAVKSFDVKHETDKAAGVKAKLQKHAAEKK